jgi:hypothetical protein
MRIATLLIMLLLLVLTVAACAEETADIAVFLQMEAVGEVDHAALVDAGADGIVLPAQALSADAVAAAKAAGLRCYGMLSLDDLDLIGAQADWLSLNAAGEAIEGRLCLALPEVRQALLSVARRLAATGVDGLIVASLPVLPEGEVPLARNADFNEPLLADYAERYGADPRDADPGSLERLLLVKLAGESASSLIEEMAATLGVPVIVLMRPEDQRADTASGRMLDLYALLSEGGIEGVLLSSAAPEDLRRPRLHTDREIVAGLHAPGRPEAGMLAALRSRSLDMLLVALPDGEAPAEVLARMGRAAEGSFAQAQRREAVARALESGQMVVVAGAEPEGSLDVATIHGVAQSFGLDAPTEVSAIGVFCDLRGVGGLGLPDLRLQLCPDADGEPNRDAVLAEAAIPASAFEGGFGWGYALFETPVALEPGTWWLHCPDAQESGASYIWRLSKNSELCLSGHAWSRTYDYAAYDWIFRIVSGRAEAQQ